MGHHGKRRGPKGSHHGGLSSFVKKIFGGHHGERGEYENPYEPQRQPESKPTPTEALVICPNCSTRNPESAKFCKECGTSLVKETKCGACGNEIPDGAKFCPTCGAAAAG